MKKVFIGFVMLAVLLLFPVYTNAASGAVAQTMTFSWEQVEAELYDLAGWVLYSADAAGGPYTKVIEVPFTAVVPPVTTFEASAPFNITGTTGTTVNKYFVVTAKNKDGVESEYSNEVNHGFVIPSLIPSKPFNLIIKITTN